MSATISQAGSAYDGAPTTAEGHQVDSSGDDVLALGRLLAGRRSCRGFLPEAVPRPVIERVLELARRSPSWCNTQPWQVLVTEGNGTERFRAGLSAEAAKSTVSPDFPFPGRYAGVYDVRRKETAWQLYDSLGIAKGDRSASALQTAKNFEFFGAPHAAVITTDAELGVYGAIDCGIYVETFLLAAQGLGLGAIPQAAIAAHAPFIRQHFGLGENRLVVCGISFGWPNVDHPANGFRTHRVPVEDTVTWIS